MKSFTSSGFAPLLLALACVAEPIANDKRQITNNAPFSGAVYIVSPNGQQVTTQGNNLCPASASVSCSNVNLPSWCCPSNYVCVSPANSNGLVGCCPAGNTCGGTVNVANVQTVTVYPQQQTAVVYANPPPATTVVYNQPTQVQGGFCATITASGPGLPRAAQGQCGTILIVAAATNLRMLGLGASIAALLSHFAVGRLFAR